MDVRRFGPGHRRSGGPPGSRGVANQVIWSDRLAHVSEMALAPRGLVAPHANPSTALFIVVSGGGWVQVAGERHPVHHGEAVVWPAGAMCGAWTEGSEMRAIVVELAASTGPLVEAKAERLEGAVVGGAEPARGVLTERPIAPGDHDASHGEPW